MSSEFLFTKNIQKQFEYDSSIFFTFRLFFSFCSPGACSDKSEPSEEVSFLSLTGVAELEGNTENDLAIEVTLSKASDKLVSVSYFTTDGSAKSGEDYVAVVDGLLEFNPGETTKDLLIKVFGDAEFEQDETFELQLTDPVNADILRGKVTITIRNDDAPDLDIPDSGYSTPESYPGMNLVWSDDFDAAALDLDSWTHEIGDGCPDLCNWGNNELQYYRPGKYLSDGGQSGH